MNELEKALFGAIVFSIIAILLTGCVIYSIADFFEVWK
jgi:cytochrome b subunit of formate dehydrogenase